jgi:MFS family permease
MQDAHDPYAALRYRDYRFLLAGNIIAVISTEIQAVAVQWELYQRTHSADSLGYAGLAQFLPVFLLALPAGQAADRYNRKHLLTIAYGMMMLVSVGLAALSFWEGPIQLVYVCMVLSGCSRALGMPARGSLVPLVVPIEKLANAVGWNSSGFQIANVVGPALGGTILALFHHGADLPEIEPAFVADLTPAADAYLASACGLLTCMIMITMLRLRPVTRVVHTRSLKELLAGIRFVGSTELMLAAITLDLFAVLLGGATALLPIFAEQILHVGPSGLGWLRASPAIGALTMALLLAHRPPMHRPGLALLGSVAGFGVATIVFGLSDHFVLSFVALALTGAFDNVSVVVRGTLIQVLTPDSMRGRVAAVNSIFISSSNELGAFESGMTAQWFGPVASVVGGGVGTIIVVLAVMRYWPRLRHLGPLHSLRPEPQAPG